MQARRSGEVMPTRACRHRRRPRAERPLGKRPRPSRLLLAGQLSAAFALAVAGSRRCCILDSSAAPGEKIAISAHAAKAAFVDGAAMAWSKKPSEV